MKMSAKYLKTKLNVMENVWVGELHVGVTSLQIIEIGQKMILQKLSTGVCEISEPVYNNLFGRKVFTDGLN